MFPVSTNMHSIICIMSWMCMSESDVNKNVLCRTGAGTPFELMTLIHVDMLNMIAV